jgi:hypothetical protein
VNLADLIVGINMNKTFTSLHCNLTTPQSVSVEVRKAVDNDGDGEDDGKGSKYSTEPAYKPSHA